MSIWITGDTHGDIDIRKLATDNWREGTKLAKSDFLIVAGDFGLVWDLVKSGERERHWVNWLTNKPWTTLFIDGNHENFDRLYKLPEVEMFGATVGQLNESIFHLKRGQIYTIEGKTFFTMGGGHSIDKEHRREFISWWKEEVPTYSERSFALDNINKFGNSVDYIITHIAPTTILNKLDSLLPYIDEYNNFLNIFIYSDNEIQYKHWYFAHYHVDAEVDEKHTCIYDKITEIK
jgi:hypothetical protein